MPPMSSYERRIVHMVIAEMDEVVTESLGEGGNRRVMIKPA
jgi:predicted RNA-binding protein Jag